MSPKSTLRSAITPLTILTLGLIAVYPILFGPALPCSDDAAFHLLRLTQLDHLIQQGVLYSRWAPDMAHGYGFPLFNFYAPLSYYLAEAISLIGPGVYWGMRLTLALAVWGGGFSMYRLARDHFSHHGALLAAIAYLYATYQGYDLYFRGNLAEAVAWPLLPLALWAMGRLMRSGSRGWLVAAAFSYAIVLLTHNVFALIFSPLLALYAAAEATSQRTNGQMRPRLFQAGLSLSLALGLSAFFWFPAMAEQAFVHIDRLLVPPIFVYWNNFLSLGELLTLPRTIHPDLLNPSPPRGLGLVPMLVATVGLGGMYWWRSSGSADSRSRQIVFFALALAVYIFLMLPLSQPLWDRAPLLPFVQFPWRLLGPAAVCLAMLVAATGDWLVTRPRWGKAAWGLVAAAVILTALFWLQPRYCPGLENPSAADIIAYEQATFTIGTTAKGEYLPVTVPRFPPEPEVAPAPFAAETLPPQIRIVSQEVHPLVIEAVLQTGETQVVRLNQFYYPGWRVWVDDEIVPIIPDPDFGLITFPLPAGEHQVRAAFGETPLRLAADGVSLLCLLILLALTGWHVWQGRHAPRLTPSANHDGVHIGPMVLGLALFGLVIGLLPRWSTPFIQPGLHQDSVRGLAVPLPTDFAGGLRLLGYESSVTTARPGETVRLDLFWTPVNTPSRNFQTNITLVDEAGLLWSPKFTTLPRDLRPAPPTTAWLPGQYAQDSHLLELLPGTPPGVYTLQLVLFDKETLQPVAVLPDQTPYLALGQITITRPTRPATPVALDPQYAAATTWGPLTLLGYSLDRTEATPGSPFLLTLFWQADSQPDEDLWVQLSLAAADGTIAWQQNLPPVQAEFPPTDWLAGETWRGQQVMRLPASLASGTYTWQLAVCRLVTEGCELLAAATPLGSLVINAPERLWDLPPLSLERESPFVDVATFMGVGQSLPAWLPGETVTVELVWRAAAETPLSYHVFLQLLGPDGQVMAQSDGEPAAWTRPTTGWLPGEIILDARTLSLPDPLPPGVYTLVTGLYLPETSQRLPRADGSTAVTVTTFVVAE